MKRSFLFLCLLFCIFAHAQQRVERPALDADKYKMKSLFNGKNLKGWYTFLNTKGKDNDPENIFSVEKGLLHISGKEFGYMCTNKVYKNFVLVVEFKWGVKKYAPREADSIKRDNGICYYFPLGAKDTVWPKSIECQVQEGDTGDFWMIGGTTIKIKGVTTKPAPFMRAQKNLDAENPTGQWNRIEIRAEKGRIMHIVNGKIVNEGEDPSVQEGKILIQSEGAEIYYRKIEIAKLK